MLSTAGRWARWLPAVLGVVAGSALSAYVLFTPVTALPDGTPATGLEAGTPSLVGLALLVPGLAVAGAAGAVRWRRLCWASGLSLLVLGALPTALGPQIWIVGLLVLLSALIAGDDSGDATRPMAAAVVLIVLAALLSLTFFTASTHPFSTAALGVSLFVGALLSAIRALSAGPVGRLGPVLAVGLVVVAGLGGAVVITEAPALTAPSPRVLEFTTTGPDCVSDGGQTSSAGERPGWNRVVVSLSANVSVPGTAYELDRPDLVETSPGRYVLTIDRRETDEPARACPAQIGYSVTLRLPRVRDGGFHVEVRYAGEVVQEVWGRAGSFGSSA